MAPEKEMPMSEAEMTKELSEQGFTERKGTYGPEQIDQNGRVVMKDEHYEGGVRQLIQIEYGEPVGEGDRQRIPSKESGKQITPTPEGEKVKMLVREHPGTFHEFTLKGVSQDGVHVDAFIDAELKDLSATLSGGETNEPWAHLELDEAGAAKAFGQLKPLAGKDYRQLNGNFGSLDLEVGGRSIRFSEIGRISVNFNDEGKPIKATIHKIKWEEKV